MIGRISGAVAAIAIVATPVNIHAGAYIFAGEGNGVDVVTHPTGYLGSGGVITVEVCIDPASANATAMEIPVQNAIDRLNALVPTVGNVRLGGDNDLASNEVDFESVFIHELGHCIGLAHVNLASESGLTGPDTDYTKSTDGADNVFNRTIGADGVRGSGDDVRGDDVNLHWFFVDENNPFEIPNAPQAGTFSRDVADLPTGDTFATNADRNVSTSIFGLPQSEAIMQQGSFFDEDQRALAADEVATLSHAQAGIDRIAGTADDYTVNLSYGGLATACDVNVDFDDVETGFAVCQTGGFFVGNSNNIRISSANTFYNTGFNWFFSPQRIPALGIDAITVISGGSTSSLDGGGSSLLANDDSGLLLTTTGGFQPANDGIFFGGDKAASISLNSNGTFTYTHDGVSTGADVFVYRACRDNGAGAETNSCAHQYVNVTIIDPANVAPTANNDGPGGAFQVDEGDSVTLTAANLSANDSDPEDGTPPGGAVQIAGSTSNGSVVDNGNQTFTFTHNDSETSSASFQYRIADSDGDLSGTATVSLTVNGQNDSPSAVPDGPGGAFTVNEDAAVTLSAAQLTANDTDPEDGSPPGGSVSITGNTVNGAVVNNGNQTFTFTHDGSETTSASFQYQVTDSNGAPSAATTVSLTVQPQNDGPLAVGDGPGGIFSADEGLSVTLSAAQLTANDTDSEDGIPGGAVSLASTTSNGGVTDNGNQTFTFTHDDSETSSGSFRYQVRDSSGALSNIATVSLAISPVNDAPQVSDDGPGGAFAALEQGQVTLSAAQLSANDSDAEDGTPPLGAVSIVGVTSNGSVQDNGNQTFTFSHDGGETTSASFQYQIADSNDELSGVATVNLTITPQNDSPSAADDGPGGAFTVNEGQSVTLTRAQLAGNDSDPEDGSPPLGTISLAGIELNGTAADNGDQTFTFTHDDSETTTALFQYQIRDDDDALSGLASVNLSVIAQNDAPVAVNDGPGGSFSASENGSVTFSAAQLTANDIDSEDSTPAGIVSLLGMSTNGAAADNGDQTFTFTHDGSETVTASFQYQVLDADGAGSNTATVSLNISPVNDAPAAMSDGPGGVFSVDEGQTLTLAASQLAANDSDSEDGIPAGVVTIAGSASNGSVSDNGDQTFTFTHNDSETTSASFQYQIADADGSSSNVATVSLSVTPINDAPVANNDGPGGAFNVDEGLAVTLNATQLKANDADAEDGTPAGAVNLAGTTTNGSVVDNGDQTFTFTHDDGQTTSATFQYQVLDAGGQASNLATVTLSVGPQDDAPIAANDGPGGAFTTQEGAGVTLTAEQLKANDSDPEDGLPGGAVTLVGMPSNGQVIDNGDQTFTFNHDGSETSAASFSYQVADSGGQLSNTALVNLTVQPVNDLPVAQDDGPGSVFVVIEGTSVTFSANQLTANDADAEDGIPGGSLSIAGTTINGSVADNGDQSFTFTHNGSETTSAGFQYQITDSDGGLSNIATVSLTVTALNDTPVANNDGPGGSFVVDQGMTVTFSAGLLTTNDSDAEDGVPQGIVILTGNASNGSVVDNGDQSFTFTHDDSASLSALFEYQVTDSEGATSNVAAVNLTVIPTNGTPPPLAACGPGGRRVQSGVNAFIATAGQFNGAGPLQFSQTGLPASLTIDPVSGEISGTPEINDVTNSPYLVTVTADNSSDQQTLRFLLTVDASNDVSFFSSFEDSCF